MFKQIEILMGGADPEAAGPLIAAELVALRAALPPAQPLLCFVRGCLPGAGAGLWVLTAQQVLVLGMGRRSRATSVALSDLRSAEFRRGRYGQGLVLQAGRSRHALIGAHRGLAEAFAQALAALAPTLAVTVTGSAAPPTQRAEADEWLQTARERLGGGGVDVPALLRKVATLHQRGMLDDLEFGTLKQQLM